MKKYQHTKNKKPTDRVSFYIALSVCMMAVGFAAWSAYTTLNETPPTGDGTYFSSLSTENTPVAQNMTGVTEAQTQAPTAEPSDAPTELPTQPPTQPQESDERRIIVGETDPNKSHKTSQDGGSERLQAVLKVNEDLLYPVKSRRVTAPYSETAVYQKTLRDYRAHTGCDFAAEKGENVYAMCDGTVENISVSELYGVILEIDSGSFSVYYCGLDTDFTVAKGDSVTAGDTIGTVGQIPCESSQGDHVHIEIRAGESLVDPLSVIGSES